MADRSHPTLVRVATEAWAEAKSGALKSVIKEFLINREEMVVVRMSVFFKKTEWWYDP